MKTRILNIREDFPALQIKIGSRPLVYLDNAATTQKPLTVLNAVRVFYCAENGNAHRSSHLLNERASVRYEDARNRVAKFVKAKSEKEIIFTRGATESLNLVARSLGDRLIGPRDTVLVTEMEHHSNLVPWQELCRRKDAKLLTLPFDDEGQLLINELAHILKQRPKLLCVAHVSNSLGTLNPIREMAAMAHNAGCLVVVDGAQAVAHIPIDVQELDCDFYAFSGHKMYSDTGIGVLYGRECLLESMEPWLHGGGMVESVELNRTRWAPLPGRLEGGTPNVAGAVSLHAAIGFITTIGHEAIVEHEASLLAYAKERLAALDRVRIYGDRQSSFGLVSFNLEGAHPFDVGAILDKIGVAVGSGAHCAQPAMRRLGVSGTVRASFGIYNNREDIDALVDGLCFAREMLR